MDVICDEVQAVMTESDRRRRIYDAIMTETKDEALRVGLKRDRLGDLKPLRLVILIPPRHSKSSLVSKLFPTWRWLRRPQDQILTLTAADTLVARDGLGVRDIIKSPEYKAMQAHCVNQKLLPERPINRKKEVEAGQSFGLRMDQFAKEKFDNTAGGGRAGHVLGSGYTGVNADIILIDDPHDVDDAFLGSPAMQLRLMEEVRATYKDKVQDRLNSATYGVVILIMQRVHPKDLADYMIEQGARVVCLPSEYQPDHPHRYREGMGYCPMGKDWRSAAGELLDPFRHDAAVLTQKRVESVRGYEAKHMLRPTVQEGVKFKREWFRQRYGTAIDWLEQAHLVAGQLDEVAISVDAASTVSARSDFTAIHVWGRKGAKRVMLDRVYRKIEYGELLREFDRIVAEWPEATIKLIENKSNGITLITDRRDTVPGIVPVNPTGDKMARANHIPFEGGGNLWIPNASWADEYVENMVGFGAGGMHDDDVDATSQVMERWATGARPWITRSQREAIGTVGLGTVAGLATRWGRREPGTTYYLGIVPGWTDGVAVLVDGRGAMVSCVESALDGFVSAVTIEADYFGRIGGGRYAETDGRPTVETIRALQRGRVRVIGGKGRAVDEKRAGWSGDKRETAELWGLFLETMREGRVGVSDARTLAQLETIVEDGGLPKMANGEAIGGRVLALLLALSAMRADSVSGGYGLPVKTAWSRAVVESAGGDVWGLGRRER
jgi:predicted phage terminase large subunit-like protein